MRVNAGDACKRWGSDPTGPPPPLVASDGPAPAYAVIHTNNPNLHTSHHIPYTPHQSAFPTPGGYI